MSPANRNYPHRTGILVNIFPSNISTNEYTIFNCSTSKEKASHTLGVISEGHRLDVCLASVFLEIALTTKWEQSCSHYMTQTQIHYGLAGWGLLVLIWARKAQLPTFSKIQQTPSCPYQNSHFLEAASDEFPFQAIKRVLINKIVSNNKQKSCSVFKIKMYFFLSLSMLSVQSLYI